MLVARFGDENEIASEVVVVIRVSLCDEKFALALELYFAFPDDLTAYSELFLGS